ncbi:MAG: 3'-5' exonuclease [Prevotellaceae bacterium]|jgi:predicted PolB exonuclease-like 3'-5' exonuclease|nr:3'-5' exonuclease [Prevotellaceae bacterium]
MLEAISPENILFLDIETVPAYLSFADMPENFRDLWDKKSAYIRKPEQTAEDVYGRAGIYAEFGKIICISAGYTVLQDDGRRIFRVKSFSGDDEKALLEEFCQTLVKFYGAKPGALLCAHNGREFDFPYIARRMLVKGIKLPPMLNVHGRKPWELTFLDTMELWKFGDYKHFISLNLMAALFDVPTPKDDIDGSMVADVYYKEHDLPRIATYCEKDVLTVARLLLKLRGDSNEIAEVRSIV